MGNKSMIGLGLAFLLLVLAVGLRYFGEGPSVKTVKSDYGEQDHNHQGEHHLHPLEPSVAKGAVVKDHDHAHDHDNGQTSQDDQPRHIDMLSPEMKQAIRDKLLLHGPMEVIQHPDGRIELPSNGRFTQMPVAVEMPDGTIQIKEYTKLPE